MPQLIIVADAGLMSNKNIEQLLAGNYEFIIGARIKNETQQLQQQILSKALNDGESLSLNKANNLRLIISYSKRQSQKR